MKGSIKVNNRAAERTTVIDIEGIIGLAEGVQFEQDNGSISTYASLKALLGGIRLTGSHCVTVNIRSTGGSVQDALLIYDFLCATGAQITTRCYGYAASAATVIAQAASPGRREISENALYLVHNSSCQAEGSSADMATAGQLLEQTDSRIAAIYAAASGNETSFYRELMAENGGRGRWLSPGEVLGYGLADTITGKSRIARRERRIIRDLALPPVPLDAGVTPFGIISTGLARIKALLPAPARGSQVCICADGTGCREKPVMALSAATDPPARLAAGATATRPREDPPVYETRLSANRRAYLEDLKNIIDG